MTIFEIALLKHYLIQDIVKSTKYLYAGIGAAVAIAVTIFVITQINNLPSQGNNPQASNQTLYFDFSYEEENSDLKSSLASHQINMSNPLKFLTSADINQYCNFLSDPKKQAIVKYCTSTELKDKQGFLGDINMVGSQDAPALVIVALQSNPLMTNYDDVKTVFGTVINSTICECWDKDKLGGYPTLSAMVDAFRDFHIAGKRPDSTTHSVSLGGKHFEIELTTNVNGYLWKLLVAK